MLSSFLAKCWLREPGLKVYDYCFLQMFDQEHDYCRGAAETSHRATDGTRSRRKSAVGNPGTDEAHFQERHGNLEGPCSKSNANRQGCSAGQEIPCRQAKELSLCFAGKLFSFLAFPGGSFCIQPMPSSTRMVYSACLWRVQLFVG